MLWQRTPFRFKAGAAWIAESDTGHFKRTNTSLGGGTWCYFSLDGFWCQVDYLRMLCIWLGGETSRVILWQYGRARKGEN